MDTKTNILIIDDDPNIRKPLSAILKVTGYAPIAVGTGQEALDRIKEKRPAVALIDLKLENISGLKLMKQIQARCPDTECIVLTGHASQASAIEAINLGAYGYVQKPYDVEQLLLLILRAIEKQKVGQTLRESEERFRDIAFNVADWIWEVDQDGVYTYCSEKVEYILGYTAEEIIGKTPFDLMPPEEAEKIETVFLRLAGNKAPIKDLENWNLGKDGQRVCLLTNGVPILDNQGKLKGYRGVDKDITARKQAEETLQRYTQRLQILHEIDQAILAVDSPEKIAQTALSHIRQLITCPQATIEVFDFAANEGELLAVHSDDEPKAEKVAPYPLKGLADIIKLLKQGQVYKAEDSRAIGELFPATQNLLAEEICSSISVPLLIAKNELIGTLNIHSDSPGAFGAEQVEIAREVADSVAIAISNARLFEQVRIGRKRQESLTHRLLKVQETERSFLARELHDEIGQALTMVKINLQVIQRSPATYDPGPSLEKSINIVNRAIQQVRNLSLNLRPLLLDDLGLVPALRWYVDQQAREAGFSAQFTAKSAKQRPPPEVEITCFRLVQEALTNVVRHAKAQRVSVELGQDNEELQLAIRDNGVGFDVLHALEHAAYGTNLGLLGMQERVSLLGGQIEINSTPARGTEIQVRLPLPSPSPKKQGNRRDS